MSVESWYNSLFQDVPKKKKEIQSEKLHKLMTIPRKPKPYASVDKSGIEAGNSYQADILFMPEDDGFRYALVVCDVAGDRATDAEPLKDKSNATVLKAFKTIFKSKYLKPPSSMLSCDSGVEFKGTVKKFFNDMGVHVRYGKPDHHQSQASVEAKNHIIGKALHMRMNAQELETNEPSTEWVEFLPHLMSELNKRLKKNGRKKFTNYTAPPLVNNINKELLDEGTVVRVKLDAPKDIATTKKLHGKFRASDLRWTTETTKITQAILRPDQPPMYLTEKYPHTAYYREDLQVVDSNETHNPTDFVVNKQIVLKLLERKKEKNKILFRVLWRNKTESWEPRTQLMKDIPDMVKSFEKG
jgi:hypothetical protein